MEYTSHGHGVESVNSELPPTERARCGGPVRCDICATDAAIIMAKQPHPLLETRVYTRKPFEVIGVQVTELNMDQIADWTNGSCRVKDNARYVKVDVTRPLSDRQTRAYVGDWVLKTDTGFKVYTNGAFHKTFERPAIPYSDEV